MNELSMFKFKENQELRTIEKDGQVWFVAKDVCNALELSNTTEAVRGLDDDEKQQLATNIINTEVGGRGTIIINESGFYKLAFKSRKKAAKRFAKWVTSEVLPAIRKNGHYANHATNRVLVKLAERIESFSQETAKRNQPVIRKQLGKICTTHNLSNEALNEILISENDDCPIFLECTRDKIINQVIGFPSANRTKRNKRDFIEETLCVYDLIKKRDGVVTRMAMADEIGIARSTMFKRLKEAKGFFRRKSNGILTRTTKDLL
jgi:prophage antirepressor-like protein